MKSIMYVGLQQVPSYDRPNEQHDRVWNGPGDVVHEIPPIQAQKLLTHPDEWADVTSIKDNPEELIKAQQAARASSDSRLRKLKNPPGAIQLTTRTIDAMSEKEIEEELQRRRAERGAIAGAPKGLSPEAQAQQAGNRKTQQYLEEQASAALSRILEHIAANPDEEKTLMNDEGNPTFAALQEYLGFSITEQEYRMALGLPEEVTG